ncbi:leucine-rich repeat domain-containing protein [Candidatus Chloroploca asiatica]|uniref:Disease resistance R13L4/SHOC-2-like LRR domain-containing protein n=1 Tax=Candidatus Chloroploca asiatica TaxID=1506545 RepID=A0A2H3L7N3_9CHLR|nr:leucine-rich repeat domain-containing protein [Candidatus Chloroploca asiatica]PDW01206.1 hypothetical protein A9Q02_21170 [Candidatus Chloroploca asiatica]
MKWMRQLGLILALSLLLSGGMSLLAAPPGGTVQEEFDCATVTDVSQEECEGLVAFYQATDGPNWTNNTNWLTTTEACTWHGIWCVPGENYVSQISLSNNRLKGAIPPEFSQLSKLNYLFLSNNQITGLPENLGNLIQLAQLMISRNQLTTLPESIGQLNRMTFLWVDNNQLTSVPASIGTLSQLDWMDLSGNRLTSLPATLGSLSELRGLYLNNNELASLPTELGNLDNLDTLHLHNNPLTGEVPAFLTGLTKLGESGIFYFEAPLTFYNTGWCEPASGPVADWLADVEIYEGTGLVCGADAGGISGQVTTEESSAAGRGFLGLAADLGATARPLAGIEVHLYRALGGEDPHGHGEMQWLLVGQTASDAAGNYQFGGLGRGIDYRVQFVDPTHYYVPQYYDNKVAAEFSTPVTVTLGSVRPGIDAVMYTPRPPAATVEVGSGTVDFRPDGTVSIRQTRGNVTAITTTVTITCPGGVEPGDVRLILSPPDSSYPMEKIDTDVYQGVVPADDVGSGTLTVAYTCNGNDGTLPIGQIVLYDPSGIVSDAETGAPVVGARVTLFHVPGWMPRTGPTDTRPNTCESHLSKAADAPWSQPAPTDLGTIVNPELTPVAPELSFQHTDATGYYGWDVSEGCWYVRVEATGYTTLVSPVVGVPPEVTDLDLVLSRAQRVFVPFLAR